MTKPKFLLSILAASVSLGLTGAANAGYFTSTITNGQNLYEDQSREAYVDVNNDGLFSVGDVLVGFARLDNRTSIPTGSLNNSTYLVFTQQVAAIGVGGVVSFAPTTTAGLTLSSIVGAPAGPTDLFAIFSTPTSAGYGLDLITQLAPDTGAAGVTLADYFRYITTNGTLDMVVGMSDAPPCTGGTSDCFQAQSALAGGPNSAFIGLPPGLQVATFVAGLEVSTDPAGKPITDTTPSGVFFSGPPVSISEFATNRGTAAGTLGQFGEANWTNASELTALPQCTPAAGGPAVVCGFTNNLAFVFDAQVVPEPATLSLMGLSLLAMSALRRRRSRS